MHGCALLLHLGLQAGNLLLLAVELQLSLQPCLLLSLQQRATGTSPRQCWENTLPVRCAGQQAPVAGAPCALALGLRVLPVAHAYMITARLCGTAHTGLVPGVHTCRAADKSCMPFTRASNSPVFSCSSAPNWDRKEASRACSSAAQQQCHETDSVMMCAFLHVRAHALPFSAGLTVCRVCSVRKTVLCLCGSHHGFYA